MGMSVAIKTDENPLVANQEQAQKLSKTELGFVPSDWRIIKVGEVCRLVNGRGFKPHEWQTRGLPIIRIQNLNGSPEFNYYQGSYDRKIEVATDELLFAWSGSRGTSFGPHVWHGPLGLLNYHTWKVVVDEAAVSPTFFYHALKGLTEFIESQAHGASALVHVQKWQMEGFQLAIPVSTHEQDMIAQALSDADALIATLEAIIVKKRALKQGAMQDLLSGCKRLPGFSGEWTTKRFGELATIRNRKVNTLGNAVATFCVELENVGSNSGQLLDFSDATDRLSSKYTFQKGDVLFGRLRPYLRKYWQADCDGVCSTEIWPLIPANAGLAPEYLYQTVQTDGFIEAASSSYGTHMPRSDWKALREYEMPIPTDADEQRTIATILADMEADVASLEAKLSKVRQIKQGMMQELLTGRVRLV